MIAPWKRGHDPDLEAAKRSRKQAEEDLERTRKETPAYEALAERFRNMRQENHFGAAIAHTFRERK